MPARRRPRSDPPRRVAPVLQVAMKARSGKGIVVMHRKTGLGIKTLMICCCFCCMKSCQMGSKQAQSSYIVKLRRHFCNEIVQHPPSCKQAHLHQSCPPPPGRGRGRGRRARRAAAKAAGSAFARHRSGTRSGTREVELVGHKWRWNVGWESFGVVVCSLLFLFYVK